MAENNLATSGLAQQPESHVDVLLICALKDEYNQVLAVTDGIVAPGWIERPGISGWMVADAKFDTPSGVPVHIRTTWAGHMGREQSQAVASRLLQEQPARCIAMAGICAGRRGDVSLGDVIFADRLYSYDAGKIVVEGGQQRFRGDLLPYAPQLLWLQRMQSFTVGLNSEWLRDRPRLTLESQEEWVLLRLIAEEDPRKHTGFSTDCPNWREVLRRLYARKWIVDSPKWLTLLRWLRRSALTAFKARLTAEGARQAGRLELESANGPTPAKPFSVAVAPMATGAAVTEDEGIFPRLADAMRKVLAVDMEAAALGALGQHLGVPVLVAKGASDFGDQFKDDRYRTFAARAAAECLIALIRGASDLLRGQVDVGKTLDDQIATRPIGSNMAGTSRMPQDLIDRFIQASLDKALKRRFFGEAQPVHELLILAERIDGGDLASTSLTLRLSVFREMAAAYGREEKLEEAIRWLAKARAADGTQDFACDDARLLIAQGKHDEALALLRDHSSAESKALMLDALAKKIGLDAAMANVFNNQLPIRELTANGLLALATKAAQSGAYSQAEELLANATVAQVEVCPAILSVRAGIRVQLCIPEIERHGANFLVPLHPAQVRFSDEPEKVALRDAAMADLAKFLTFFAPQLDLPQHSNYLEEILLLLRLSSLDDATRKEALDWLQVQVQEVEKSVRWARFAADYEVKIDLESMREYLGVRKQLGGWTDQEAMAALVVALRSDDYSRLLSLIREDRDTLSKVFELELLVGLEVEVLARTGDVTAADALLSSMEAQFGPRHTEVLRNLLKELSGGNALNLRLASFRETGDANARRMLIDELLANNRYSEAAEYLSMSFDTAPNVADARLIAKCLFKARDYQAFNQFMDRPDVRSITPADLELRGFDAWSTFFKGQLQDGLVKVSRLRELRDDANDRNLESRLFIESGDWQALAGAISRDVKQSNALEPRDLLSAAETGRVLGMPEQQLEALISSAGAKAMELDDPSMLVAAWHALVTLGSEKRTKGAEQWLQRAVELSGSQGPVHQKSIGDLADLAKQSRETTSRINDLITSGAAPLAVAASPLNATLTDLVAGNLIRNSRQDDPRFKVGLPLFAGNRIVRSLETAKSVALDRSALMCLGFLGLLETTLDAFEDIVIPRLCMAEFMDELGRVQFHQPSRVEEAKAILTHIAASRLQVAKLPIAHVGETSARDDLDRSLQGLLRMAEGEGGVVIVSPPLHKVGTFLQQEVDPASIAHLISGPHEVVDFLSERGLISGVDADRARIALSDEGKRWVSPAKLEQGRPLFLDRLAAERLSQAGLIEDIARAFPRMVVEDEMREDFVALVEYAERQRDVADAISRIRECVLRHVRSGKIRASPMTLLEPLAEESGGRDRGVSSLRHLLADPGGVDFVVIDDRAVNKLNAVETASKNSVPIATSLDLLWTLRARGALSDDDFAHALHSLRQGGVLFVPLDRLGLAAYARSGLSELLSFELQAVADYLSFVRVRRMLQLPLEQSWLGLWTFEVMWAIRSLWSSELELDQAEAASARLLNLIPDLDDWLAPEADVSQYEWSRRLKVVSLAFLGNGLTIHDNERKLAYLRWVENAYVSPLLKSAPELSADLGPYIQRLLLDAIGEAGDVAEAA